MRLALASGSLVQPPQKSVPHAAQPAEALLNHKADVNKAKDDGQTPLTKAVDKGHLDIVELLIASGVAVNALGHPTWRTSSFMESSQLPPDRSRGICFQSIFPKYMVNRQLINVG